MSTTSDGEHSISHSRSYSYSYPSWLPKRPPPPAPASTFHSTSGLDMHPRRPGVLDIFSSTTSSPAQIHPQGRKPTPRSVRIVAKDVQQWRTVAGGGRARLRELEQTGDSAETRVVQQQQPRAYPESAPPHRPQPRFRAPSLHLDLLRSPTLSMRIRYRLHPFLVSGHLILQTFFDFNAVFMIIQTAKHPGPMDNPKNWDLATAAYLACYFIQIIVIFILYELVYSFWRRWRVKRPLILPIYLSSAAHNFVALTSYSNYCFLAYIRRSARPSFRSLVRTSSPPLIPPPRLSNSPSGSGSLHSQAHARSESVSSAGTTTSSTSTNSFLSFLTPFTPYIAESAYFFSQNTPTVISLLPRATLCVALLLQAPAGPNLGRDSTYFDASNGALTGYARGILFTNAAWTLWRTIVLLGSFTTLWILSGSACAGICGPRYRWEEYPDPGSEVEVDDEDREGGGWAFVNLSPWRRGHSRHYSERRRQRRGRKRATSESVAYDNRNPDQHESVTTSSFFSPGSPPPPVPASSEKEGQQSVQASPQLPTPTPIPPTVTRAATTFSHYPTPPARAYMAEDPPLSDTWDWKRGTRKRIREAWEFCLTNTGGKWLGPVDAKKDVAHHGGGDDGDSPDHTGRSNAENDISLDSDDLKGLDEVLKQSILHRNALRSRPRLSPSAVGLSDILPPPDVSSPPEQTDNALSPTDAGFSSAGETGDQFGSQRSRRSDPLRVLPFPIRIGAAAAPVAGPSTTVAPAPATPTTGTTLTMTSPGIPFPSPTRSRSRTRLETQMDEEEEEEEKEEEEEGEQDRKEGEEAEEGEEGGYEEEIEEYDDDFIDDDEEDYREEEYDNVDDFDPEAEDVEEEYDDDGEEEEGEVFFDEFGAPITAAAGPSSRRGRGQTSASASGSGSASMSSLGRPINGGGGYAFSTVGSATVSSASRSAGRGSRSGTGTGTHSGSRMGTVSSRGSRGTRLSSSVSGSASRSGMTASGSASGTRSSRRSGSTSERARRVSRGWGIGDGGRGRGSGISAASPSTSVSASASPQSQQQQTSPQTIASVSSPGAPPATSSESQSSPDSQDVSPPHPHPLPPPPAAERTRRPRRERGREYTATTIHLRVPDTHPHTATTTGDAPPGIGDTSLDIEFPVPASVYPATGGNGGRISSTTGTGGAERTRTRTMSSAFAADLVLPQPMPEGHQEDDGDEQEGLSYLGSRSFPVVASSGSGGGGREHDVLNEEAENSENENENEDLLGLLSISASSSARPAAGSNPGSAAPSSPHTRSPRSSLKSLNSRPSLASLAASLGANLNMSLGVASSSRRVSYAGPPGSGSRSRSREGRGNGGNGSGGGSVGTTPPLPPLPFTQQPTIRSRAQSLIQSIRNRSSSFVELVEMREDEDDAAATTARHEVTDSPVPVVGNDEEDMTVALPFDTARGAYSAATRRRLVDDDNNEDEDSLSSPGHHSSSFSSPGSNHNALMHTPHTPSSNSPHSRIIGVPRGFDFGTSSRRESSGTSSGGTRSSGEGRRPGAGPVPAGTGSEGTFGRPGELAGFIRRERESAGENVEDDQPVEGFQRRSLPTIPSVDMLNRSASRTALAEVPDQVHGDDNAGSRSRTAAVPIPNSGQRQQHSSSPSSPSVISTAPASLITAPPSVAFTHTSTTESLNTARGDGGSTSGGGEESGTGASTSIDPLWRDQARRGAGGPVAGGWHLGPA